MNHLEGTFQNVQNKQIYYQAWLPENQTKAVVIIVHGIGAHSGRHFNEVNYLVQLGFAVYGFDLPGHGKSEGEREILNKFEDYTETLMTYLKMVKVEQPGKSIFLLGASMGGLIACYYLLDHPDDFEGAIISAPGIMVADDISQLTILTAKIFSKIAPKMRLKNLVDVNGLSKDPDVVQAFINDPLVYCGKTPARLCIEMLKAILRVNAEMDKITIPLIIVQGTEDKIVNPHGAQLLHDGVSSKDKNLKTYEGMYHGLFSEPEREQVLSDVAAWLDAHL